MKKAIPIVGGLALLGFSGWLAWIFIESLTAAAPGVAAAVISFIGAVIIAVWTHAATKRREINSRHFIEKKNAYMHVIDLIFDLHKSTLEGKELSEKEMMDKILEFKKQLVVWGSAEALKIWDEYEQAAATLQGNENTLLNVDKILRCVRKELGHDDKILRPGDLVALLLKAEDKHKLYAPAAQIKEASRGSL